MEEKDIVVMAEEPCKEITIESLVEKYTQAVSEKDIADVYAIADNKMWWTAFDLDEFEEETQEYRDVYEIFQALEQLTNKIQDAIEKIMISEGMDLSESGKRAMVVPFMERNGYCDGNGWWINMEDTL